MTTCEHSVEAMVTIAEVPGRILVKCMDCGDIAEFVEQDVDIFFDGDDKPLRILPADEPPKGFWQVIKFLFCKPNKEHDRGR